jgi:hypothetical protein
MADAHAALTLEEVTDPTAMAQAQAQGARCARNMAWLQAHAAEVYPRYRGKHLCIAGETLFVADTPEEAWALATAAHPEDDGRFLYYVPREVLARIYAH